MNKWILYTVVFLLTSMGVQAQSVDEDDNMLLKPDSLEITDTLTIDTLLQLDSLAGDTLVTWPENVCNKIDKLLESRMFQTSTVGIEVYDLTADSIIYRHNERQSLRPASTMKMINAVATLDALGGSYQFKTQLKYTGKVDSCVLHGNLYCKGGLDPRFNNDDMRAFVESIKQMGIDTINGNIYADITLKDEKLWGEGWCWDDDNPNLSPLLISGKNLFMNRFCAELSRAGIVLKGDTLRQAAPYDAKTICTRTHSIDQILMRMMKKSDNLYAEALFYQLAASMGQRHATAKMGRQQVNKLITKLGCRPSDYYIADGSGLSLYNYVSADLEVRFLRYAYENENIYNHLLPAMPIAGVDGTLQKRMRSGFAHGNVKAKTGTVTGVSALSGYCTAANGHYLCFSIINQGVRKAAIGRNFQDKVCEILCHP